MHITIHPSFKKSYKKRIARNAQLADKVAERITLFKENPRHPLLRDHALIGKQQSLRAFSVTGDICIVYAPLPQKHSILLLDIGTHNQVY